jgi:hypothetical protein
VHCFLFVCNLTPQVLAFLASEASASPEAVLGMCMRLGEVNFKVMALLDNAHTSRWVPVSTIVQHNSTGKVLVLTSIFTLS